MRGAPPTRHRGLAQRRTGARRARLAAGARRTSAEIAPAWAEVTAQCIAMIEAAFEALPQLQLCRLHGDCHPANPLDARCRAALRRPDDAVTGPAVQDLWMLLSGDADQARQQLRALLEGCASRSPTSMTASCAWSSPCAPCG